MTTAAGGKVIAVFGAAGHTGRFVMAELRRRGMAARACGRDAARLEALYGTGVRVATAEDGAGLDRAFEGAAAVINCAGPFMDTAPGVIGAALRARIPYLDVTAEQPAAQDAFQRFGAPARAAGTIVLPAMAFYGGLGDLLASRAMGDWDAADEITIAVALDSWRPTAGTRRTGERNTAPRQVVRAGRLAPLADPPDRRVLELAQPFGATEMIELPLAEIITVSRHLKAEEVRSFMNLAPLADLRDPATPPPQAADASGRSDQRFLMQAAVRRGTQTRLATASGRDIYAVTAPLVVEATERILDGRIRAPAGAFAAGELFDAGDFLAALSPEPLRLDLSQGA